jgi:segregation and condensation protein A
MEFTVKLDRYEGPYTKLLELIEQRKLSITEISLVSVADDYIAYIKSLEQKNLVDISQFIVVASTLILMKAKSLIPDIVYTEEEEKQVHDLEAKLELYALLTKLSGNIKGMYGKNTLYSRPHAIHKGNVVFVPDVRVDVKMLQSIATLTLATFIQPKVLVKVAVEQALRIENVIEGLLKRVSSVGAITLQSMAGGATTIVEQKKLLIVNFIALLELLRSGGIHAEQHVDGGDIEIKSVVPSV